MDIEDERRPPDEEAPPQMSGAEDHADGEILGDQAEHHKASESRHDNDLLRTIARAAFDRGWWLTPLEGKQPILSGWQKAPRADWAEVEHWIDSGHNLGVRTGSASGVVVIDIDAHQGGSDESLSLPTTVTALTGGGGYHCYFKSPPEPGIKNSVGKLAPHVDVRAEGGQVVLPGSIHPKTNARYEWLPGHSPDDLDLAEFPSHLIERLTKVMRNPPPPPMSPSSTGAGCPPPPGPAPGGTNANKPLPRRKKGRRGKHPSLVVQAQLALGCCDLLLRRAPEGTRNDELNKRSFMMGRYIGANAIDRESVETVLRDAAISAGLIPEEVNATIASGLDAGIAQPHESASPRAPAAGASASLEETSPPKDPRDVVPLLPGFMHVAVDAAEDVLMRSADPLIYQRGSVLVRVVRSTRDENSQGIRRRKDAPVVRLVDVDFLSDAINRLCMFMKDGEKGPTPADCPARLAQWYLSRAGHWKVPKLEGVLEAPAMLPEYTIRSSEGFDVASGFLLIFSGQQFPGIAEQPTIEDAREALAQLADLIGEFPFKSDVDRSVALAALITPLARPSIRTAPAFAFTAPVMGSGKSLLAHLVSALATGRSAPAMSQGRDEEEDRKRVLALLIEAPAVVLVDNVERPMSGDAFCSALTEDIYAGRLLGKTQIVRAPTRGTTWLMTGNGLVIKGDLRTRVLVCKLDPKHERPWERHFAKDLRQLVADNRPGLVAAALTILRAFVVAGRPRANIPEFGRFEEWSGLVRGALLWLGMPDPVESLRGLEEDDPDTQSLIELQVVWADRFQSRVITAREAIIEGRLDERLATAIMAVAVGRDGQMNAARLGHFLGKMEGRICQRRRFVRAGSHGGTVRWRLESRPDAGGDGGDGGVDPAHLEREALVFPMPAEYPVVDTDMERREPNPPSQPTPPESPQDPAASSAADDPGRSPEASHSVQGTGDTSVSDGPPGTGAGNAAAADNADVWGEV